MNASVTLRGGPRWPLVLAASSALAVFAGQPPAASDPIVELPPMIVMEPSTAPPWLYVAAGDTEFLSRCSSSATRTFVTTQLEIHRLLRAWVPAEFLATHAVPNVSVLVPLSSMPARDDAVFREMLGPERALSSNRYEFLPNQRLDDRDMMAVFTFLDEGSFEARRMIVATDYVHALLSRRTPMLPQWLIEGVVGLYVQSKARDDWITLDPVRWISRDDTSGLQRDPEARRVLLSCDDLFAPDADRKSVV